MKLIRNLLDKSVEKTKKGKLSLLHPMLDAVNTGLFDPDNPTKNAPHIRDANNSKRFIISVVIALFPVLLFSIYHYGLKVLWMLVFSYAIGAVVESFFAWFKQESINEGFLVTGLLFVLIFPINTPLWIFAIAIVFGIIFGKEVFGGVGQNPFNPALTGRIFAVLSWPSAVSPTEYIIPNGYFDKLYLQASDALTTATPLSNLNSSNLVENLDPGFLILGPSPGCIGEISSFLLILGGIYLIATKVVNFRVPLAALISVTVFTGILHYFFPSSNPSPFFHIFTGGLLLGVLFMATDPVVCPDTSTGKWIYGFFLGISIILIRKFTPLPEGVMFSILIMNIFAPLMDEGVRAVRMKKEKAYE
ncbi:MAG: RnfABCDGE type electron transport complex subunit D [Myxococcota bacterium]